MESESEPSPMSKTIDLEPPGILESPRAPPSIIESRDEEVKRIRRHWRPQFVEIPELEQSIQDTGSNRHRISTPESPWIAPASYTSLNPFWPFKIRKRQRAEEKERRRNCKCPISLNCEHKPTERKDCRIYAPHYGKHFRSTNGSKQGWQRRDREKFENYHSLIGYARSLARLVEEFGTAHSNRHEAMFDRMRSYIQELCKSDMDEEVLRDSKVLDAMQNLRHDSATGKIDLPLDVRDDLRYLERKWKTGDLSVDEYRGVIHEEKNGKRKFRLDPDFGYRLSADFYGSGHLVNGQHWPKRICMLRDGAHRHLQAGICGRADGGAQAVVLGKPVIEEYADVDMGDEIWYVGTAAKGGDSKAEQGEEHSDDGIPIGVSNASRLLFKSKETQKKVRVFRSGKLPKVNKLKPRSGFRYDGCYKVVDCELLEEERALYRFKMVRCRGQAPIRVDENDEDDTD